MSTISACPGCGVMTGEDYDGKGCCWTCFAAKPSRSSWLPVELQPILDGIRDGKIVGPVPTLMPRTDGVAIWYPGEVQSLSGEPESGKGLIVANEAARLIEMEQSVLILDFEDAPASIVKRLLAFGASPERIAKHLAYVRPVDPLEAVLFKALTERDFALVVPDGVTEAFALLNLDIADNVDIAKFLNTMARPFAARGACVVLLDHVVKNKESRGRYAIGGQHKLAGVAAAFSTDVITHPSREKAGLIKLKVEKDRHGQVRGHADPSNVIALVHVEPSDGGERIQIRLEPPDSRDDSGAFRPTVLMERVEEFLTTNADATSQEIENGVTGRRDTIRMAINCLVKEDKVVRHQAGKALRHKLRSTLETADSPIRPMSPQVSPGESFATSPNRPTLKGGVGEKDSQRDRPTRPTERQ